MYQNPYKCRAQILFFMCSLRFFTCQMQINEIISVIFHQQTTIFIEMPAICCFGSTIIIRASQGCTVHCTQWNANEIYFVMLLLLGWWRKRHHNYTHVPLYLICQLFHFQGCVYTCSYLNVLGSILQSLTHFWIAVRVHVVAALQVNNTLSDKSVFWAYEPAII